LSRVASQNSRNYWVGGYFLSSARKWGRNPDKEVSCNDSQLLVVSATRGQRVVVWRDLYEKREYQMNSAPAIILTHTPIHAKN
jgi:hypothetical protein